MNNTYAMGVAMNATNMASVAGTVSAQQTQAPDVGFAQLLAGATGTPSATPDAAQTLSWREIQVGMVQQAMQTVQDAEQPVVTDPVLAELLTMLKELSAQGAEGGDQIELLLKQLQQRLQKLAEQNGGDAAQQLMAVLAQLGQEMNMLPQDAMQATPADGGQAMLNRVLNADPKTLVQQMVQNAQVQADGQTAQAFTLPQQVPQPAQPTQPQQAAHTAQPMVEGQAMAEDVQVEATPAPVLGNTAFENAVRAVKQQLGTSEAPAQPAEDKTEAPKLDIDALQQQVDAGTFVKNTVLQNTEAPPPAQPVEVPVPAQVMDGVQTALINGKGEVTIKLNPEALGEVTIKLAHTAEGMQLSIIAKHDDTQKLLAGELDTLRDSLRPLKVEVDNILTERQYELLSGQQNFGGQQERQFEKLRGAAYYGDEPLGEEAPDPAQPISAAPSSALDAYI